MKWKKKNGEWRTSGYVISEYAGGYEATGPGGVGVVFWAGTLADAKRTCEDHSKKKGPLK